MKLSKHLNSYIFQLIHAIKASDKKFVINDMILTLVEKQKRFNYNEEKIEATRVAKNSREININAKSNESKRNRDNDSCDDCNNSYHDKSHCLYLYSKLRFVDWKLYELKLHFVKNYDKKNDFVSINKSFKNTTTSNVKDTIKKIKFTFSFSSSNSFSNSFSHLLTTRNRLVKIRKINKVIDRDLEFYLDSATNAHICYNKVWFNEIESLDYFKSIEVANDMYFAIKEIKSIIFDLDIHDKKITNIVTKMKYVLDIQYNFLFTNLLCRKDCKIEHDKKIYIMFDIDNDNIFMIDTIQSSSTRNFYIVDRWNEFFEKMRMIKINDFCMQWHRRLNYLNMKNVKKLVAMSLIDSKLETTKINDICELCVMSKMHKTLNKKSMRVDFQRRANRKSQRIHIDLIDDDKIVKTSRGKRYVIVFVNDYTNYTWIYLIRIKNEYKRVLKEFIMMLKTKNINIETIRCDNVDENINDDTNALLKEHDIKWESTISNNSHQNDMIERAFRIIFNRVRACLYDFKLFKYLWDETCHTIVYLKNINFCTTLEKKTSYEVWNDK